MGWEQIVTLLAVGLMGGIPAILAYRRGELAWMMAVQNASKVKEVNSKVDVLANGGHDYALLYGQVTSVKKQVMQLEEVLRQIKHDMDFMVEQFASLDDTFQKRMKER